MGVARRGWGTIKQRLPHDAFVSLLSQYAMMPGLGHSCFSWVLFGCSVAGQVVHMRFQLEEPTDSQASNPAPTLASHVASDRFRNFY